MPCMTSGRYEDVGSCTPQWGRGSSSPAARWCDESPGALVTGESVVSDRQKKKESDKWCLPYLQGPADEGWEGAHSRSGLSGMKAATNRRKTSELMLGRSSAGRKG